MRFAKPIAARRPGFTIIEMLVVIAIIAVLASMIVGATMRTIAVQTQKNSTLLVQKVYDAVNAQWNATVEQANNEVLPPLLAQQLQAGADPRTIRATYIILRLQQQFPTSYALAMSGPGQGVPPDPFYAQMLSGANMNDNPAVQSGVCLWLALKNSRNGAIFNQDVFTPREVTTSGVLPGLQQPWSIAIPNVFCLVDDWKQPIQLQFVPYATAYPQGAGPAVSFDLGVQNSVVPVITSSGPPPAGPTINSNQLVIGGPNGS